MLIERVLIEEEVKQKILQKHNVRAREIRHVFDRDPYMTRTRDDRYLMIGKAHTRFLTVIFEYSQNTAFVVTAYDAADWQKNLYKEKKET